MPVQHSIDVGMRQTNADDQVSVAYPDMVASRPVGSFQSGGLSAPGRA